MKRKSCWFLAIVLLCAIVFIVVRAVCLQKERGDNNPNGVPDHSNRSSSLKSNAVSANKAIDPYEMEIKSWNLTKEEEEYELKWHRTQRDGADAKITFHVTDFEGINVANAICHTGFIYAGEKFTKSNGSTDEKGLFTAEGKTASEVNYVVQKEGYYTTSATYVLGQRRGEDVKNGKWYPWNPTIEITLREKRNPIPMYVLKIDNWLIPKGKLVEFDCKKGDWVKPYGKGETGDFAVYYESSVLDWWKDWENHPHKLIISAKDDAGFIQLQKESSAFTTMYKAPEKGYDPEIILSLEMKDGKTIREASIDKSQYLIFRSRVEKDEKGNIIHSHFGKITSLTYGEDVAGKGKRGYINFLCYFNPSDNDRNLEYDCKNNLLNPRERINAP